MSCTAVPCATHPLQPAPGLAERSTVAVSTKRWHGNKLGGSLVSRVQTSTPLWQCSRHFLFLLRPSPMCCGTSMQMLTPPPEDGGISPRKNTPSQQCAWTDGLPQTDHVRFFLTTDWSRTTLGPLEGWSQSLRLFATFVLQDSRPACLWWGDISNLTAIYNEQYAQLAAGVHPKLMGSLFQDGYPDLWPSIRAYFDQAKNTGTGINYSSATSTLVERKGYREEAFFSGGFSPVGMPGAPDGFINTV